MPVVLWRFRQWIVLGACLVASVVLLTMEPSSRIEAARRVRSLVYYPLEKALQLRDRYGALEDENRRLRLIVTRLVEEQDRLDGTRAENERLRAMLGFRERGYRRLVPGEVIGWDRTAVGLHLEIDQGESSELEPGDPVVSVDGLVGKVVEVHARSSWVVTLRSPECPVSVLNQRSRVRGIARWRYPDGLVLDLVGLESDVREGDLIISSGLGGVFPKGLRVGVVRSAEEKLGDLFQTIALRPAADFDRLEEIAVLVGEPDTGPDPWLEQARAVSGAARDSSGAALDSSGAERREP